MIDCQSLDDPIRIQSDSGTSTRPFDHFLFCIDLPESFHVHDYLL